ncbi:MAG: DNA polymerase III subunit gamma/tau [Synergistaceae bacterium]|nr:DNA polymerase III subunit gamma/tau [Synergistaceae bacterium]
MIQSLYRKYRPQNFASVVGQKSAVDVITSSLAKNRPGHAYLFSGSRGCGKTSVARIFAKALNCLNPNGIEPCGECANCKAVTEGQSLDVIEIDGASNNSVEQVRALKENVALAPFSSKYKIYIIDEVHMLTAAAFNALLKTLEEPPEHVIFIMATTEPQKVPVTIRSRCQHIPFHSIGTQDIYNRLDEVCRLENVNAESEALWEIARQADGALRDALSLLEQVISYGEITLSNVESAFGAGSRSGFERWVKTFRTDKAAAYIILKSMFDSGASGVRVFEELFSLVRNLWLVSRWKSIADSTGASEQEKNFLLEEASNWKSEELHSLLAVIMKTLTQARSGVRPDILLGMFFVTLEGPAEVQVPVTQIQTQNKNVSKDEFIKELERFNDTNKGKISVPAPVKKVIPDEYIKPSENVPVDEKLKEELISTAYENNKLIVLCALFDSRPYVQDKKLILDFAHRYSYEAVRRDQTAAEFTGLFTGYEAVLLRYGSLDDVTCPAVSAGLDTEILDDSDSETEQEIDSMPGFIDYVPEEPPQTQAKSNNQESIFDKISRVLSNSGARCEIVLRKSLSSDSEQEQDSDSETDSESESEGEE